jgi:hypothetical protein
VPALALKCQNFCVGAVAMIFPPYEAHEPRLIPQWRDPGDLVHRRPAAKTDKRTLAFWGTRHEQNSQVRTPSIPILDNFNGFPQRGELLLPSLHASHADQHHLQGHRFDAETVRLMDIAYEMALVGLQQRRGASILCARLPRRRSSSWQKPASAIPSDCAKAC